MTSIAEEVVSTEFSADDTLTVTNGVNGSEANGVAPEGTTIEPSATSESVTPAEVGEPFVRVVKGAPSDEELAALVTVLASAAAAGTQESGSSLPPETWGDPVQMHRTYAPFSPYSFANAGSHRR
ncbi:MAG: acyl-CoA carboxylase subunit epsilon [Rhodococcus sp.]|nr:acyl-CoA carboxylase subunit epsilon [Rhodococcus sp. (in: high G+C Gram-positive bacteria)]